MGKRNERKINFSTYQLHIKPIFKSITWLTLALMRFNNPRKYMKRRFHLAKLEMAEVLQRYKGPYLEVYLEPY